MKKQILNRIALISLLFMVPLSFSQTNDLKPVFGPVHAETRGAGPGHIGWFDGLPPTEPKEAWTITACVKSNTAFTAPALVAGFGDGLNLSGAQRYLAMDEKGWIIFFGDFYVEKKEHGPMIVDPSHGGVMNKDPRGERGTDPNVPSKGVGKLNFGVPVVANQWIYLAATYDGKEIRLYANGKETLHSPLKLARAAMQTLIGPPSPWKNGASFNGKVAYFSIYNTSLSGSEIEKRMNAAVNPEKVSFAAAPAGATPEGRTEPFPPGRRSAIAPQNPDTLPRPVPAWTAQPKNKINPRPVSAADASGDLVLNKGWELIEAQKVNQSPEIVSMPGVNTAAWYDAIVPGTVLTTLVQQGIYPDPLYGLNNMIIPDLSRNTWWYRVEFRASENWKNKHIQLTFKGINYHSDIWLNGNRLGETTGAFIRGVFDVSRLLKYGENNVLAVRVWPQPHNGQAHEESIKTGQGPNGADGCLDGPTFVCTEGWDWIPTIRDRNTGIWQDVVLHTTGPVKLGDPKVTTVLPKLPDLSVANVTVETELQNLTRQEQKITLKGEIAGAAFAIPVNLASGERKMVTADPAAFSQLAIQNPKLWWPNGYGQPALHDFTLKIITPDGKESDVLKKRIGLRMVSYDALPHLCIKINGRRIMAKGGNWGLDDAMKRCSREMLEPYFKLHQNANVTIIRNWVGQSTEDVFYQLCDEYGMMVWNDFWLSTVPGDLPAIDGDLFMANAADVVKRYRTHACIVIWCARNEGEPPAWIASRLDKMLKELDGTREYVPSSWGGKVKGGGPYHYSGGPAAYFNTAKQKGFNTELGVNSVPTADAIRAMLPAELHWPINDAWAYHDFHSNEGIPGGNYFKAIENNFGKSDNLDDFVKRAQMLNYDLYRAMFEGWNACLWKPASGVMLWMTHPAQPSMVWQTYSKDYDTHAAYYGMKKACEPLHVQWSIADNTIAVINNLFDSISGKVTWTIYDLNGNILSKNETEVTAPVSSATEAGKADWSVVPDGSLAMLKLEWKDNAGRLISENVYWRAEKPEQLQGLQTMPQVKLDGKVAFKKMDSGITAIVELSNPGKNIALMAHMALRDAKTKQRILPAYFSDNYVTLLPGEKRTITILCSQKDAAQQMVVSVDGWNIDEIEL